jgi:hypothetical protein
VDVIYSKLEPVEGASPADHAGEVQSLLAAWVAYAEMAITAVEHDDSATILDALARRDELLPHLTMALERFRAGGSADPAISGSILPFPRILADISAAEDRLSARLGAFRNDLRHELDRVEHGATCASAYRQIQGRDPRGLNLKG